MKPGRINNSPSDENNRIDNEKNQTLKDPGAAVADYGSSGKGNERLDQENESTEHTSKGNDEGTLGIP
jgi:hypothetical protein